MPDFTNINFVASAHNLSQLPPPDFPEIAFAGRSNVGKSSLINCLVNRKNLVKTSATPGKTQGLNYFLAASGLYLVDLPGYGYARVPKAMQEHWRQLISAYLESRSTLRCVVVIVDLRHALKSLDLDLVAWLRAREISFLPVYTKQDKLSRSERLRQAAILDAQLRIGAEQRVLFSAKTGEGRDKIIVGLDTFLR